jgi:hypothetical protein
MRTRRAPVIEERVHGDLPEPGELGLSFTHVVDDQTVVGHAVVERVGPEGVLEEREGIRTQVERETMGGIGRYKPASQSGKR